VESRTEDEIRSLLGSIVPLYETEGRFTAVSISVVSEDTSQNAIDDPSVTREVDRFQYNSRAKVFLNIETNKLLSMDELWSDVLRNHYDEAFAGVAPNGQFVSKTIETRKEYRAKYRLIHNGTRNRIQTLIYTADVQHHYPEMRLTEAASYSGGDGPPSVVARWRGGKDNAVEIGLVMNKPIEPEK